MRWGFQMAFRNGKRAVAYLAAAALLAAGAAGFRAWNSAQSRAKSMDQDAEKVVAAYLEAEKNNDAGTANLLSWRFGDDSGSAPPPEDPGVKSLSVETVRLSEQETRRIRNEYGDSDLAKSYGWPDGFIDRNLIAVYAHYAAEYDHDVVPADDGDQKQYFYLVRKDENSPWRIWQSWGYAAAVEHDD